MWLARVHITLKESVLDPQGSTVQKALAALGYEGVQDVRVGKYLEVTLDASDEAEAERQVDEMCRSLLANPVIEKYSFQVEETG